MILERKLNIIRKIILILIVFILHNCSVVMPHIIKLQNLPRPSGNHFVGTQIFTWIDESRSESFTKEPLDYRKIVVQLWYPAENQPGNPIPYIDYHKERLYPLSKYLNVPKFTLSHIKKIQTNSYSNADINTKEEYPLIIFSHGLGGMRFQNTIQAEELASNGYIVLAIDHPYDANVTIFSDGTKALFQSWSDPYHSEEERIVERTKQLEIRSADVRFVITKINHISQHDIESTFYKLIDIDKIGIFGHSFGGSTSIYSTWLDDRIDACLNLEGWFEPIPQEVIENGIEKPILSVSMNEWKGFWTENNQTKMNEFIKNSSYNDLGILIEGAMHSDFADYPHLTTFSKKLGKKGILESEKMLWSINKLTLGFFDMVLKGKDPKWLEEIKKKKFIKFKNKKK